METPGKEPVRYTDTEIINKIYVIRGQRVMTDYDLAEMYGVTTSRLNEAVKRNIKRFPEDFMFQITEDEAKILISQNAMSSLKWGGRRRLPYVFTGPGVSMLSSILTSERAIEVNIHIMRVYSKLSYPVPDNTVIWQKIEELENAQLKTNEDLAAALKMFKAVLSSQSQPRNPVGFQIPKPK